MGAHVSAELVVMEQYFSNRYGVIPAGNYHGMLTRIPISKKKRELKSLKGFLNKFLVQSLN